MHRLVLASALLLAISLTPSRASAQVASDPGALEFFEKHVRPIFVEHCQRCHGDKKQEGGLRLDASTAVSRGSDSGPVIIPGEPGNSLLLEALRYESDVQMPPDGKLPDDLIRAVSTWIEIGAPWPKDDVKAALPDPLSHWAFQPVRRPQLPSVADHEWIKTPIDAFVLARLEQVGIQPASPADRRTLIRRAYFDLHGLPPTPEEMDAFERDPSPDAFENLVERLLASPRYGERWGRYWLDVARYADTKGYVRLQENPKYSCSWTYRDYVIRAFNEDLPYDDFLVQQLAADQLDLTDDRRPLAAMGFLTLGQRFINSQPDIIDDRIDVVTRGLLGLTASCARCHDHKFDPIATREYYGLYGVFASSVEPRVPPILILPHDEAKFGEYVTQLHARTKEFEDFLHSQQQQLSASFRARSAEYLYAGQHEEVQPNFLAVMFLVDSSKELNPVVVQRWARLLAQTRKQHHGVLAPWHALAKLSASQFEVESQALIAEWTEKGDSSTRLNPLVVAALKKSPPVNLPESAERYGELFRHIDQQWQQLIAEQPEARALPDAAAEEIRQVLYAPDGPFAVSVDEVEEFLFVDTTTQNTFHEHQRKVEDWIASPHAAPHALTLVDRSVPIEPHIFVRGNPSNPGELVPRAFLSALNRGETSKPFQQGSGRLEMARAIADESNPLTARVFMNRVWMHHFGAPIVPTPSDFGLRSEPPSHPELLDYLAWQFMANGWSLKEMHRLMMHSSVYQQQSCDDPHGNRIDPENRWLWKANRRRLDWESLRDSLLFVSGELDVTMGGPSMELFGTPPTMRRTVYGFIDRQNLASAYRTFDFIAPDATAPQRHETTVPQQALFLLNSPFMKDRSRRVAQRIRLTCPDDRDAQIAALHKLLFGRMATAEELQLGKAFLSDGDTDPGAFAGDQFLSRWEEYVQAHLLANEFIFID